MDLFTANRILSDDQEEPDRRPPAQLQEVPLLQGLAVVLPRKQHKEVHRAGEINWISFNDIRIYPTNYGGQKKRTSVRQMLERSVFYVVKLFF